MVVLIVFFALISSGSVFAAAYWQKRYEEILPVTCTAMVMVMFLSGIMRHLLWGAFLVCGLALALYAAAAVRIWKKRAWLDTVKCTLTPAFVLFAILYLLLAYWNRDKMAALWDEFSHWMDIVKVTTLLDDFGTNPAAHSLFQSYPPGVTLFQYMMQKLNGWLTGTPMSEWKAYFAYQIFAMSFLMPFLRGLQFKKPVLAIGSMTVLFLCPMLFYPEYYISIYVDPFLGIVLGAGLAALFLHRDRSASSVLHLASCCAMLVLAKDAGMLFACFLAGAFVLVSWLDAPDKRAASIPAKIRACGGVICATLVPYSLWKLHLELTGAEQIFSGPYDMGRIASVLLGRDDTYLTDVWHNFIGAFFNRTVSLNSTGLSPTYFTLCLMLMAALGAVMVFFRKKKLVTGRRSILLLTTTGALFVVYVLGIAFTYIDRFAMHEALGLASFERYLHIVYLGVWVFLVLLLVSALQELRLGHNVAAAVVTAAAFLMTPTASLHHYVTRAYVADSQALRAQYDELAEKIDLYVPEDAAMTFVSQEDAGFDYYALRYITRPHTLANWGGNINSWSVGVPFFEGDVYTYIIFAEEWQRIVVDNYDYVAIHRLNDYFHEYFSIAFANPDELRENEVYRVNKETRLLELCTEE